MTIPSDFIIQMNDLLGETSTDFFSALDQTPTVSVRLNHKISLSPTYDRIPYCRNGYYLPHRPSFTMDPWFHAGVYYVQEAGSMYIEYLFKKYIQEHSLVLDLCAAPGGKSTHIASLLNHKGLLVSNEVMPQRANILNENMTKWGYENTIVTNNQPRDFLKFKGLFNVLVTDVPCSGEGMFRKEPVAIQNWSRDAIKQCANRQRSIIEATWETLRSDGILLYSTCTFNKEENEDNVRWIATNLGAELLEERHFYFHTDRSEGFYIAALRKTSDTPDFRIKKGKNQSEIHAIMHLIGQEMRCLKVGIVPYLIKGKDRIPTHALAMSINLDRSQWPTVDLDYNTALKYLHGECVVLDTQILKGYTLLTYRNVPIGWGKNLNNRCNNLYPDAWKIRMNIEHVNVCELPF